MLGQWRNQDEGFGPEDDGRQSFLIRQAEWSEDFFAWYVYATKLALRFTRKLATLLSFTVKEKQHSNPVLPGTPVICGQAVHSVASQPRATPVSLLFACRPWLLSAFFTPYILYSSFLPCAVVWHTGVTP